MSYSSIYIFDCTYKVYSLKKASTHPRIRWPSFISTKSTLVFRIASWSPSLDYVVEFIFHWIRRTKLTGDIRSLLICLNVGRVWICRFIEATWIICFLFVQSFSPCTECLFNFSFHIFISDNVAALFVLVFMSVFWILFSYLLILYFNKIPT